MSQNRDIPKPQLYEKIILRIMILLGLASFSIFYYWFFNFNLIDDFLLFWLLAFSIIYDTLKIMYMWYHYWALKIPDPPIIKKEFSVDVFTTFFPGEPYAMVTETLLAIQKMRYLHTTYLCDEANDPYLKDFCQKNNIIHVTRDNRIDAKAGNINNALRQATGDICLILDPDHIPYENFLEEVIPYFEDDKIGYVQTVQAYYNTKQSLVAKGAAEQTYLFYGPLMMSMNTYGTVNAIGANCVFRREALDSIGGHAAGLSEDMHTAMQLHAKGWKSVYIPKSYTKGLAPASLTSYYKQQLKWSRGTFDLLVNVYPKLFRKFTLRQKIHYGVLPLHYLSGIITLINFLIPIVSLFAATTPWKGNFINFGLIFLPIFVSVSGIRFFIQRWLIYRKERGVHITGGLLQICTWWVYIIGFLYTLIRKRIPYLPTPKEDNERTVWKLVAPNIVVAIVSIVAVIYGLSIDFTPFSIFMSGFALLNAFFMFYTLRFAYQKQKVFSFNIDFTDKANKVFSTIQNFIFYTWRKSALLLIVASILFTGLYLYDRENRKWKTVRPYPQNKNMINYLGIINPIDDNITMIMQGKNQFKSEADEKFNIRSIYLSWDKHTVQNFPRSLIDSIFEQRSIPLITWEPCFKSFIGEIDTSKHIFDLINAGIFDYYIADFANQLKDLNRPVFLRFAHQFDNSFYSWYDDRATSATNFKKAWVHTYEIFKKVDATNVIWVWNPSTPDCIESFYPGRNYIDWIGVNILNLGKHNKVGKWQSFKDLYKPFHQEIKKIQRIPVMISEFGSVAEHKKQEEWYADAFESINNDYDEIKSVIMYNSNFDKNRLAGIYIQDEILDRIEKKAIVNSFSSDDLPDYLFEPLPDINLTDTLIPTIKSYNTPKIKGINLKKGQNWREDYHVLNRRTLLQEFKKIRQLGINSIRFEGNTIYAYNILNIAKEYDLSINYGFRIPTYIDFMNDTISKERLMGIIINQVKRNKSDENIIAWNIQNDVLSNQTHYFLKPRLLYQNKAYLIWLKDLVRAIKEADSTRPVIIDLENSPEAIYNTKLYLSNVPGINAFGLVIHNENNLDNTISFFNDNEIEYLFSDVEVDLLAHHNIFETNTSFFVTSWQDGHEINKVSLDGIVDRRGRYKTEYYILQQALQKSSRKISDLNFKIMKPAILIYDGRTINYSAMFYHNAKGWRYGGELNNYKYEWSLIKCDQYGNYLAIKDIAIGPQLSLRIPNNNNYFKLLLTAINGDTISTSITTLNTPLWNQIVGSD